MNFEYWNGILTSRTPHLLLESAQQSGHLGEDFPEIQAMVGFGGSDRGHKDLWDHTKKVVRQAKNIPEIRWAALWHDVGKVRVFSTDLGKVTFHRHEQVSARFFREAMQRTKMAPRTFRSKVYGLVWNLGLVEGYSPEWTDSAVRRLHRELGPLFRETLLLARADVTSRHKYKREKVHRLVHDLEQRALRLAAEDAKSPPLPKGLGNCIMTTFGIPPSKLLGGIKTALEKDIEAGLLESGLDSDFYIEYLRLHSERFGVTA